MNTRARRKTHRLIGHDYSLPGHYFVTICTHARRCLLGEVRDERVHLSRHGRLVAAALEGVASTWSHVILKAAVVMPNHAHAIVTIGCDDVSARFHLVSGSSDDRPYGPVALGDIVRRFKALASYEIHRAVDQSFRWQRSYWDHYVRDEDTLKRIADYVMKNPRNWPSDVENTQRAPTEPPDVARFAAANGLLPDDLPLVGISSTLTSMI